MELYDDSKIFGKQSPPLSPQNIAPMDIFESLTQIKAVVDVRRILHSCQIKAGYSMFLIKIYNSCIESAGYIFTTATE